MIGDGMGPAFTTAYRYYQDDQSTGKIELTVFDRLLVGMASTYPARVSGYVTDSAAAATALATGVKTYRGAIAVDVDKQPVETLLERAKKRGKATGIVVTSHIYHATPAAFMVHNERRGNYSEIADDYFDDRVDGQFKADVMLGGGWKSFMREDRNLVNEFIEAGYQYIDSMSQLPNVNYSNRKLLGLFADTGLKATLDDKNSDRLLKQTVAAVRILENNENGFVLMIEGSQIDWAGHGNDIARAMGEMEDFANTMEWVEQYVKQHPDTLMVATADHKTGGLAIGYHWQPKWLKNLTMSPEYMTRDIIKGTLALKDIHAKLGFELTEEELSTLALAQPQGFESLGIAILSLLDQRSNTKWASTSHSAGDVQVFSAGLNKSRFSGHQDNTEIGIELLKMLN